LNLKKFKMSFDSLPTMFGGLVTAGITKYLGFSDPFVAVLGASVGGGMLSKILQTYNKHKDSNPLLIFSGNVMNKLQQKVGLNYNSVTVGSNQKSVYERFEAYILNKYRDSLAMGTIRKTDNVNIELSLGQAMFNKTIVDHYNNHRLYLIVHGDSIEIRSYTADMSALKEYIQNVMNTRIGQRQIIIYQCVIERSYTRESSSTSILWNTFTIETNKTLTNTIVSKTVQTELFQDLEHFIHNEPYYNAKGIPYKRGYMLYGPPGTGKTSIIKSVASHYGMSIYIVNMCDVERESDVLNIFKNIKGVNGYYILCFEDFDRSPFLGRRDGRSRDEVIYRAFINELDGIVESNKRITFITANDETFITSNLALCRPGRIDRNVKIDFCDADQLNRLYKHYTSTDQELQVEKLHDTISACQVVKYILENPSITPEEFKKNLKTIEVETKNDIRSAVSSRKRPKVFDRFKNRISMKRFQIKSMQRKLAQLPERIQKDLKTVQRMELSQAKKKQKELAKKMREKKRKGTKGKK